MIGTFKFNIGQSLTSGATIAAIPKFVFEAPKPLDLKSLASGVKQTDCCTSWSSMFAGTKLTSGKMIKPNEEQRLIQENPLSSAASLGFQKKLTGDSADEDEAVNLFDLHKNDKLKPSTSTDDWIKSTQAKPVQCKFGVIPTGYNASALLPQPKPLNDQSFLLSFAKKPLDFNANKESPKDDDEAKVEESPTKVTTQTLKVYQQQIARLKIVGGANASKKDNGFLSLEKALLTDAKPSLMVYRNYAGTLLFQGSLKTAQMATEISE